MKIAKTTAVLLAASLISTCAEASYNISYKGGNAPFYINGSTDKHKADQIVTLKIENNSSVVHLEQTQTNTAGEYGFVFELENYGEAEISIYENNTLVSTQGGNTIYKSTAEEILSALRDVNQNGATAIENHYNVLQVHENDFAGIKDEQILKNHIEKKNFAFLDDFLTSYNRAKLLIMINRSSNAEEIKDCIGKISCTEELSSTNAGNLYIQFTDENKKSICEKLAGIKVNTSDELVSAINEQVILKKLAEVQNYNEKIEVLEQNNDYLNLDFAQAKQLGSYYNDFKRELIKKDIGTVAKIKTEFASLLNEYKNKKFVSDGSGGGGSSSKNTVVGASADLVSTSGQTEIGFIDMDGYEWASNAVKELSRKGIINGRTDKIFAPSDNVTRAEFVKLIVKALSLEQYQSDKTHEFSDMNSNDWFYNDVQLAYELGIVNGTGESTFSPFSSITRQDMAVICIRALKCAGYEIGSNTAPDSLEDLGNVSQYAKECVEKALSLGIMNGYDNMFHPHDNANRAQAAVLMQHIMAKILK